MKRSFVITLALCTAAAVLFAQNAKPENPPAQKPYSENSVIVKKPSTPIAKTKAAYVKDKTASAGMATFQTGKKSSWGVQWHSRDFAPKLKPNAEYVFKMRLRPEFEDAPDCDGYFSAYRISQSGEKDGTGILQGPVQGLRRRQIP